MNKNTISIIVCIFVPFNFAMSTGLEINLEPDAAFSGSSFKRERRNSMVDCASVVDKVKLIQEPEIYPIKGTKPKKAVHFAESKSQELVAESELKAPVRRDSIDEHIKLEFNNKIQKKLSNDKLKKGMLSKFSDAEKELLSGIANLAISDKGDYYIEYLAVKLLPTYKFSIKTKKNVSKLTPEEFKNVCKSHLHALMKKDKQDLLIDKSQIDRIIFAACDMHKVSINDAKIKAKAEVKDQSQS